MPDSQGVRAWTRSPWRPSRLCPWLSRLGWSGFPQADLRIAILMTVGALRDFHEISRGCEVPAMTGSFGRGGF
jgi:hypothetical protein